MRRAAELITKENAKESLFVDQTLQSYVITSFGNQYRLDKHAQQISRATSTGLDSWFRAALPLQSAFPHADSESAGNVDTQARSATVLRVRVSRLVRVEQVSSDKSSTTNVGGREFGDLTDFSIDCEAPPTTTTLSLTTIIEQLTPSICGHSPRL